jgi:hypothetical protein
MTLPAKGKTFDEQIEVRVVLRDALIRLRPGDRAVLVPDARAWACA